MTQTAQRASSIGSIPPLEAGDRLTREEFERRWDLHPEIKKAELIDGMVYLEMTVGIEHGEAHALANVWLGVYRSMAGDELQVLDNATVRLMESLDLQPDVLLRRKLGGTSTRSADGRLEGPPELVFEIAGSSASYDLHLKRDLYLRAGVQEYLVWQVYEERIDWWTLEDEKYVAIEPNEDGIVESRVFAGLRLNVAAMLAADMAAVLAALAPAAR